MNYKMGQEAKKDTIVLHSGDIRFGDYRPVYLLHSDRGDLEQISSGSADIIFSNSDFVSFWTPEK